MPNIDYSKWHAMTTFWDSQKEDLQGALCCHRISGDGGNILLITNDDSKVNCMDCLEKISEGLIKEQYERPDL